MNLPLFVMSCNDTLFVIANSQNNKAIHGITKNVARNKQSEAIAKA